MSKKCELTGVTIQTGNNVSHSHKKTKRRFLPNLQTISLESIVLQKMFSMKIAVSTLRSVVHNAGLDGFLLNSKAAKLTKKAQKLRRFIKKALKKQETST